MSKSIWNKYLHETVKIINCKPTYEKYNIIRLTGFVETTNSGQLGVKINGRENSASQKGLYWFRPYEVELINGNEENKIMTEFNKVAIVNLLEDYYVKDYAFALYDEEYEQFKNGSEENILVVVNPRGKDNRVLGKIKEIMPVNEYKDNNSISAQVVGVVNLSGYNSRVEEEKRQKELSRKKAALERELEKEINKRKSVEYYEEMAKKYSDNPKLAELVAELKSLGE